MKVKDIFTHPHIGADLEIKDIACDSRLVKEGSVFFALPGVKAKGVSFIEQAFNNGAILTIAAEKDADAIPQIYQDKIIYVENPRASLAEICRKFYQPQIENMVAVTGTSGKTSVVSFFRQICAANGYAAASIGTTGVTMGDTTKPSSLTTPDTVSLHKLVQELALKGVTHMGFEASSHGLEQYRLDGIDLKAAAFTNLGRDHLDYHIDKESYFAAKMLLFERILPKDAPAIIFADDIASNLVVEKVRAAGRQVLTVGRQGDFIQLKRAEHARFKQQLELSIGNKIYPVEVPLAGSFQVNNILVALGLALAIGLPVKESLKSLSSLKGAAGRMELVGFTKQHCPVYVDYAHKPEALENVLSAIRPFTTGRVFLLFGCGGDRDAGKRPIMGEIANRLADKVIVTDDNPRTECPASIRQQILQAAPSAIEIADRRAAIEFAINSLKEGDSLIIAGKGHEEGQIFGDKVIEFSDFSIAKSTLENLARSDHADR